MKIVKTLCNLCRHRCGLNVYIEDNEIVQITGMPEHPRNNLCIKAYAIPELVYSSERLTNPLIKIGGKFKETSWDEALGVIAHKLADIKEKYGAKALVEHCGTPYIGTLSLKVLKRFLDVYGTPNYTTGGSFCFMADNIGRNLTCGIWVAPHYTGSPRCILLWGTNPDEVSPVEADAIHAAVGRGAKLIVVDPRATAMAKRADIHAQIRPGTDCALALGLLNVIIEEGLYDKAFVEQWTIGFEKLIEHVKEYTPEKVETTTWVPAEKIRSMARLYATNNPACVSTLGIPLQASVNGIQTIRAITTLIAITGNLDVPGGNIYSAGLRQTDPGVPERVSKDKPVGADYPLFTKYVLEQSATMIVAQILTEKPYPIKALFAAGSNLALTWANTDRVKKALEKLELLVVADIFMTDTAKMADVVLPSSTFLERQELRDYFFAGFPLMALSNKAIEPIGNSMEDWRIWAELGKKMGYAEYFPWKDSDELIEFLLKPTGVSLDQLKQNPGGIYYREREFKKYLKAGFNTPSKKVEIYSEMMKELGYDPLPVFREPLERSVNGSNLEEKYPLMLVTAARTVVYHHTQGRNLPSLRKLVPEPLMKIHPKTASNLGVADGDLVKVESVNGSIKIKTKVSEDIHPKTVYVQHGWSDANVNYLTEDGLRDPVSGYPGYILAMCRVSKATK
jgi:anaerobic selenocysteine-containing dehydrogenase